MSLIPDFHQRVKARLGTELSNLRGNLEKCAAVEHDRYVGQIRGTDRALAIVNEEFSKMGGEDE